jgi:hypothetical protein
MVLLLSRHVAAQTQIQQIQREREAEVLALAYETNTAVEGTPLILV